MRKMKNIESEEYCRVRKQSKMLRGVSRKELNSYDTFRLNPERPNCDLPREEERKKNGTAKGVIEYIKYTSLYLTER